MTLQYVGFNQDQGCFACGLENEFRVFNTDPLKEQQRQELVGTIGCVEMLFRCNYLALIGCGSNPAFGKNHVILWNDVSKRVIADIDLTESDDEVLLIRLRKDRIVVVLSNSVRVYSFTPTPQLLAEFPTSANPRALCALSAAMAHSVLVFPKGSRSHSSSSGCELMVVDLAKFRNGNEANAAFSFKAHNHPVTALAITQDGTLLATASEKGTLVRLFSTQLQSVSGSSSAADSVEVQPLAEFRRGIQPADIFSIAFNASGTLLAVGSDHYTIHVFNVTLALQTTSARGSPSRNDNASTRNNPVRKSWLKIEAQTVADSKSNAPTTGKKRYQIGFGIENSVIVLHTNGTYVKYRLNNSTSEYEKDFQADFLALSDDL